MNIQLSDHFTYRKLLRFTLPSITMMIFTSIYGIVDGFFVSNFAGKTSFAAVNLVIPFLMILGSIGFMLGTGGSAVVAKTFGQGDGQKAKRSFSLFVYVSIVLGIGVSVLGYVFMRPICVLLGAEAFMLEECVVYGRACILGLPAFILQLEFQSFFVTAEKPQLGLYVTLAAGVTNMVLDALLVGVLHMGVIGAALATAASQWVGGVVPLVYFFRPNDSLLRLTKTGFDGKALLKACTNGSSEFLNNIAMSFISILYNIQLLAYAGENGVAAYGVIMYVSFIFAAAFIGYSIGTAPVIGYHDGAQNHAELKNVLTKSLKVIGIFSVCMVVFSQILALPLSKLFVGYDVELMELTCHGLRIYSISFFFMGYAIFGSGFFTALNDGLTSALISFLRTLVFQLAAVLLLPLIFGIDGIWLSVVAAELMAVILSAIFLAAKRNKYHYY